MPTATPFTALGRGNGFPFCLDLQALINVHGDIWDRTEPIAINPLMSLLWNLYVFNSLSFTFTFTTSLGGAGAEEYTNQGSVSYDGTAFDGPPGEPYKRVCFTDNALPIVQILDSQNTFEGEFFFLPTLDDDNNYCLAYIIDTPDIKSPKLAATQSRPTNGEVAEIQFPLDDEGNTTVIKAVGFDFGNGDTTTATGGAITSNFYTYN
jgi:hypothetical protein